MILSSIIVRKKIRRHIVSLQLLATMNGVILTTSKENMPLSRSDITGHEPETLLT